MTGRFLSSRPILTGWAFFLPIVLLLVIGGPVYAQHGEASHETPHEHGEAHGESHTRAPGPHWEGSAEGVAFSNFNHHLAGIFILVIGLTELWGALGIGMLAWSRFLLPAALFGAGIFLLTWSDHEAWPIGSMSLAQTLLGGDWEILQHKIYALLLLSVGTIEGLRWLGRLRHSFWSIPFPAFAIVGGLMLFLHSHGDHPSAHEIAMNHAIMGTLAVAAGFCKLVSVRTTAKGNGNNVLRWDLAWAGCILLVGLQLLFYSE
jgi:putative copper resistance protein D